MLQEHVLRTSYSKIAGTIDRRENLSRKELIKEYIEPSRPVILTDAASKWPGMGKVTPDFIKTRYGHLEKEIKGVTYTFAELIDRVLASSPENPAPYPFNVNLEGYCPDLRKEFKPEIVYGKVDRVNHPLLPRFMMHGTDVYELFIGGRGASFPFLHIDELYLHNQLTQLYGSKEFIMYPSDQTPYLYTQPHNPKVSQVDVLHPDYDRFPLFKEARPIRVTVQQGETLLFPTGWWHTTQIHEPSISLGRCHLNAANWNEFVRDESKVWKRRSSAMALAVLIYGIMIGKVMDVQDAFVRG
jgi:histone arginine demethylase JMJD6